MLEEAKTMTMTRPATFPKDGCSHAQTAANITMAGIAENERRMRLSLKLLRASV
jgi:hypothetical protein